jgi:Oxidoreductase family, NAD-binding Rossmann fold
MCPITGSMAERRLSSRLMAPNTPRFCPEMKTRCGFGASWPRYPFVDIGTPLIGVAGYVSVCHLNAIKVVGGNLKAALDPADSVGAPDSYFSDARFFVEFGRFDRHIDKLRRQDEMIDYVRITSPNYLHDAHVRFVRRSDADAICEKPLVLNPWNIDGLVRHLPSLG